MAGDHDRDRVLTIGGTDGTDRARPADACGNLRVGRSLAKRDVEERGPDRALKGCSLQANGEVEAGSDPSEVLVELVCHRAQRRAGAAGTGAEVRGPGVAVEVQSDELVTRGDHQDPSEWGWCVAV